MAGLGGSKPLSYKNEHGADQPKDFCIDSASAGLHFKMEITVVINSTSFIVLIVLSVPAMNLSITPEKYPSILSLSTVSRPVTGFVALL
jgi:hypothetical protein